MLNGLFQSRRFWLAVATTLGVVLKDALALPVTEDQVQFVVLTVAAWIVGDSLRVTAPKQ